MYTLKNAQLRFKKKQSEKITTLTTKEGKDQGSSYG